MYEYFFLIYKRLLFPNKQSTLRFFYSNQSDSGKKKKKWYRGILSLYFVKNDQFHKTNTQSNFLYKLFIQNLLLAKHCAGFQADKINILRPVLRKITTVVNFYFSYFSLM